MKKKKQTCYVNKRIEIICLLFPKVNYNQQKHIINTYPTPFLKIKKHTESTLYILYV